MGMKALMGRAAAICCLKHWFRSTVEQGDDTVAKGVGPGMGSQQAKRIQSNHFTQHLSVSTIPPRSARCRDEAGASLGANVRGSIAEVAERADSANRISAHPPWGFLPLVEITGRGRLELSVNRGHWDYRWLSLPPMQRREADCRRLRGRGRVSVEVGHTRSDRSSMITSERGPPVAKRSARCCCRSGESEGAGNGGLSAWAWLNPTAIKACSTCCRWLRWSDCRCCNSASPSFRASRNWSGLSDCPASQSTGIVTSMVSIPSSPQFRKG